MLFVALLSGCRNAIQKKNFSPILGSQPEIINLIEGRVEVDTSFITADGQISCKVDLSRFKELKKNDPLVLAKLGQNFGGLGGYAQFDVTQTTPQGVPKEIIIHDEFVVTGGNPEAVKDITFKETRGNCIGTMAGTELEFYTTTNFGPMADAFAAVTMSDKTLKLLNSASTVTMSGGWNGSAYLTCAQAITAVDLMASGVTFPQSGNEPRQEILNVLTGTQSCRFP